MRGRVIAVSELTERDELAWRDLATRAVEPNPLYEPDCLIPAARHQRFGKEIGLLIAEEDGRFHGCFPIRHVSRFHKFPYPMVVTQVRRMIYQGTPLVDARRGVEAVSAMLATLVEQRAWGGSRVLALQELTADGPVAAFFRAAASDLGLPLQVFESFERGLLRRGDPAAVDGAQDHHLSRDLRKKRRRLARELGEEVEIIDRGLDPEAIEEYMALESSGYKARTGVAMTTAEGEPAFFRDMCARFAAAGRLHVLALSGGRTVAMVVWIRGDEGLFQIKASFDDKFAQFSPGIQLYADAVRYFHLETDALWLDSCTSPDNELLLRVFPDRRRICSFFIILGSSWRDRVAMRSFVTLRPLHRRAHELTHSSEATQARRGKAAPGEATRARRGKATPTKPS
jgi:hypothetical protein